MERATATAEEEEEEGEDDIVCLDESFFINDDYQLTTFTFGSQVLQLFCLQSASTDFDLTGQLVWPGATLLNNYLSKNPEMLSRCSVIELGSGVGVTGILCSRFCCEVILTDHNEEVLKILNKNIDLHSSTDNSNGSAGLMVERLEWGNSDQLDQILNRHPGGFDLVLGADICFQQSSIPLLFDTVQQLLHIREEGNCKFLLAYVSRAKVMDAMVISEANEDVSLGSWFIGLEVEHIDDRNMCCGAPPEKNLHLTIPGFSSEERKSQQNHMAFGIDMWIFHFFVQRIIYTFEQLGSFLSSYAYLLCMT